MAERLRVTGNGAVGIGTSSPAATLDVNGGIAVAGTPVIDTNGNWVGSPAGLEGPPGPAGIVGLEFVTAITTITATAVRSISCPAGKVAISGGTRASLIVAGAYNVRDAYRSAPGTWTFAFIVAVSGTIADIELSVLCANVN
jgi:hypothetical protein